MRNLIKTVIPCLALTALVACDDGDTTGPPATQTANVRFVNTIADAEGNLLLTANGQAVGSALTFGAAAAQCVAIPVGTTSLQFGTANTGGTGIATSLGTISTEFANNGNVTLVAAGTAASPQLFTLNNTVVTQPTTGNAMIRIVSVVPGTTSFDAFATAPNATLTTPTTASLTFGTTGSTFVQIPAGETQLRFTNAGSTEVAFAVPTNLTLASGDSRTVLLAPGTGGTGFQAITLAGC